MIPSFLLGVLSNRDLLSQSGGGGTAVTRMLLHFDGANGATTSLDASADQRTLVFAGNAQLTTDEKKFGSASLVLAGSGGRVEVDTPGISGDFCIEAFVRVLDNNSSRAVITMPGDLEIYRRGGTNTMAVWTPTLFGSSLELVVGTWHHIAFSREGPTARLFVDGQVGTSFTYTSAIPPGTSYIGSYNSGSEVWNGQVDEVRLTTGAPVYTGTFTPPAAQFSA